MRGVEQRLPCVRPSPPKESRLGSIWLIGFLDLVTAGVPVLLQEYALDGTTARFALLVTMPVIFCVFLVRASAYMHLVC
jgi:hypothetical protein